MVIERSRRFWVFGALGCLAISLIARTIFHKSPIPPPKLQTIPVTAVQAVTKDFTESVSVPGTAQAWTSVTVNAQVSGKLVKVGFTEGAEVSVGQWLAEVDPAPYQAVLEQAEGTLQRDQAILAGAQRDLERYQTLQKQDSIATQTVDDQIATVAQNQGTVKIDKAAVAAARINLNWCRIVSPVSGRVGVRLIDVGNLVSSSSSMGIVVVNQIQPIAVTFAVTQGEFNRIRTLSDEFRKPLTVHAYSQEDGTLLDSGELRIADNKVDSATGTVQLKARFANAQSHLWAGQFVNVQLATETIPNATVIPTAAVNRGPNGSYVFVIDAAGKAQMRTLVSEGVEGMQTAVKSGVAPGETVITDGQMTVKQGSLVHVVKSDPGQAS